MTAETASYDPGFYDRIRAGCQRSAAHTVPVLLDQFGTPASVVDVGCGEGWWLEAFRRNGVTDGLGVDGGYVNGGAEVLRLAVDLSKPLRFNRRFDWAVSLEVAEHLPPDRAFTFVEDLCVAADTVVFSAAIPGQGGRGHVNCQPPAYWAQLFACLGYGCVDTVRDAIWGDDRIEPWYRSNIMVYQRNAPVVTPELRCHPDMRLLTD